MYICKRAIVLTVFLSNMTKKKKTVTSQSLFLRGNFVRLFLNVNFILVLFVVLVFIIVLMFQSWGDVQWMLPTK